MKWTMQVQWPDTLLPPKVVHLNLKTKLLSGTLFGARENKVRRGSWGYTYNRGRLHSSIYVSLEIRGTLSSNWPSGVLNCYDKRPSLCDFWMDNAFLRHKPMPRTLLWRHCCVFHKSYCCRFFTVDLILNSRPGNNFDIECLNSYSTRFACNHIPVNVSFTGGAIFAISTSFAGQPLSNLLNPLGSSSHNDECNMLEGEFNAWF